MFISPTRLFVEHPSEVGESYTEHAAAASSYGWRLLKASLCAFAHALVPAVHKTTASDTVKAILFSNITATRSSKS